jgi:DNA-binding NtrC family response regulator
MACVLIVDDEQNMRWVLHEAMTRAGHTPHSVATGPEALALLSHTPIDLVVLDLKLKGMDGLAVLREIHARWPQVVVVILTAYGTVATAVEALQNGAADYLRKPFDVEELVFKIARSLERQALQQEVAQLRRTPVAPLPGSHPVWRRAIESVCNALEHGLDVRLVGEAGSGKATIARYAHAAGPRHTTRLIELDAATIPTTRQSPLLAGTPEQGGFWAVAGQGVLLLRHVEFLTEEGLATLAALREQRDSSGVGPLLITTAQPGTPPDPLAAEVVVPPLRDHRDDIPLCMVHWCGSCSCTPEAERIITHYGWPGNLAELRGVVERAMVLADGAPIDVAHLPAGLRVSVSSSPSFVLPPEGVHLEQVEVSLLRQALAQAEGNKTRAAELLGLSRQTLLYRLEKYRVEDC